MKRGSPVIIDTNVLLVANEQHPSVSFDCVMACIEALDRVRTHGLVVIDDGYEILLEYTRRTAPNTGNQVGDAFLKWLYQNAGNPQHVVCVHIERRLRLHTLIVPQSCRTRTQNGRNGLINCWSMALKSAFFVRPMFRGSSSGNDLAELNRVRIGCTE